ncbi:hypothetical protein BCD67_20095 [Oscillatoriales cyanobacterium USR001]|nr:hypothetical protein BCD67_20095 [Oscillatoriales cyanobacterium USR001]
MGGLMKLLALKLIPILLHLCNSIRGGLFNILANSRDLGEPAPTKTVAKFLRIGINILANPPLRLTINN